ncbi:MAG: hypothetical protein Q8R24_06075 [Legionellaceae bacterium]|nr:hypothetical protein [Legionellaceae bacterium]
MKEQLINEMIDSIRDVIRISAGDINSSPIKKFPTSATSIFKQKIDDYITKIEESFPDARIPEDLLPLIIANVIRTTLEMSSIYKRVTNSLTYESLQQLNYNLDLFCTQDDALKSLRIEPSFKDLESLRPHFNPGFHGEFAYALLHILNGHKLYVEPSQKESIIRIGHVTATEQLISDKPGELIGWRAASIYGVDMQLAKRKKNFHTRIDSRECPSPVTMARELSPLPIPYTSESQPMTIAIWNRNSSRDSSRHLSLELIKKIVITFRDQEENSHVHVLLVGDLNGLSGIDAWTRNNNMMLHDYRNAHIVKDGAIMPKDEQLYTLRDIMKNFNPKLIVGPRSGLVALCALVGCQGLQIDLTARSNTQVVSRTHKKPYSPLKSLAIDDSCTKGDNRLIEIFARCPVDGIGPYVELTQMSPTHDTVLSESSNRLLELTIAAMMVAHDPFQPLALEMLASHLAGNPKALQNLIQLLDAYKNSRSQTILMQSTNLAKSKEFGDPDGHDDSHSHDDFNGGGKSDSSTDKSSENDSPSSENQSSSFSDSAHHYTRAYKHKDKKMEAKCFFDMLEGNQQACKEQFLMFNTNDKNALFIDAILNLEFKKFKDLFMQIIPKDEQTSIVRHNNFIVFEYALSYPEILLFLLQEFNDSVPEMLTNSPLLCCALQHKLSSEAENLVMIIKSSVSTLFWSELLIANEANIARSMTQNIGVGYALEQVECLSLAQKQHVLRADNYVIFRYASSLKDRLEALAFLESICISLDKEARSAINAYGGDIIYQALLKDDHCIFSTYYNMLSDDTLSILTYRIETDAPEKMPTFIQYQNELSIKSGYITPPREATRRHTQVFTPDSVATNLTPPFKNTIKFSDKCSSNEPLRLSLKTKSMRAGNLHTSHQFALFQPESSLFLKDNDCEGAETDDWSLGG